jgi:hypothetical protein
LTGGFLTASTFPALRFVGRQLSTLGRKQWTWGPAKQHMAVWGAAGLLEQGMLNMPKMGMVQWSRNIHPGSTLTLQTYIQGAAL